MLTLDEKSLSFIIYIFIYLLAGTRVNGVNAVQHVGKAQTHEKWNANNVYLRHFKLVCQQLCVAKIQDLQAQRCVRTTQNVQNGSLGLGEQ